MIEPIIVDGDAEEFAAELVIGALLYSLLATHHGALIDELRAKQAVRPEQPQHTNCSKAKLRAAVRAKAGVVAV